MATLYVDIEGTKLGQKVDIELSAGARSRAAQLSEFAKACKLD
ncbi:MAG TPA: hypothetical protein VIF65_05485 [Methyloceanibacter sp.]